MSRLPYLVMKYGGPIAGRATPIAYPLAELVATVTWTLRPALRRSLANNMRLAGAPPSRANALGRRAFKRALSYWVDAASLPYRDMRRFEQDNLHIINPEHLDVLKQPGPLVIASGHCGNAELAIHARLSRERPFVALVEPLDPPEFLETMLQRRNASGAKFVPANREGLRTCIRALHDGGVVGLMADVDIAGTGICTLLFGRCVRLPRGPWDLARRSGGQIVPMFCLRRRRDHFVVRAYEPYTVAHTADSDADLREAAQRWARSFEDVLRRDPSQWVLLHDYAGRHACAAS